MASMRVLATLAALLCCCVAGSSAAQVPIVLWHGMGDSCYNPGMNRVQRTMERHVHGLYVKSLCFGDSLVEDSMSGFFLDANAQVEMACRDIAADEKLKDGYHAIGLSQGGQFLRAVAQRCPSPPMKVLVSLGGQHQGVFGLPRCAIPFLCKTASHLLSVGAYWQWVQRRLVQAQYWHDPVHENRYRRGSTFLADINNDHVRPADRNASYADNLAALERLVLVRFAKDSMVSPRESQWFEFYAPGSTKKILPLEESAIYKEDWIGLRRLAESGRLERLELLNRDHLEFNTNWLLFDIVDKYMRTSNSTSN